MYVLIKIVDDIVKGVYHHMNWVIFATKHVYTPKMKKKLQLKLVIKFVARIITTDNACVF